MKKLPLCAIIAAVAASTLLPACTSPGVQDARISGVDRRQDRIDSRTYARQERWNARSARQDARSDAWFDSW